MSSSSGSPPRGSASPDLTPLAAQGGGFAGSGELSDLLTSDGHGNITHIYSSSSFATNECTAHFDPFGEPENANGSGICATGGTNNANDRWYRGGNRDATTGSYQWGSRFYRPGDAAWSTPDSHRAGPSGRDLSVGTDPLTSNRYTYVNGDPVNLFDPSGHVAMGILNAINEGRLGSGANAGALGEVSHSDRQRIATGLSAAAGASQARYNILRDTEIEVAGSFWTDTDGNNIIGCALGSFGRGIGRLLTLGQSFEGSACSSDIYRYSDAAGVYTTFAAGLVSRTIAAYGPTVAVGGGSVGIGAAAQGATIAGFSRLPGWAQSLIRGAQHAPPDPDGTPARPHKPQDGQTTPLRPVVRTASCRARWC